MNLQELVWDPLLPQVRMHHENQKLAWEKAATEAKAKLAAADAEQEKAVGKQAELEKKRRVDTLMQIAARRITRGKMARGWGTWHAGWEKRVRQRQLLAAAAGRLMRPMLGAAYSYWLRDWAAAIREAIADAERAEAESQRLNLEQQVQYEHDKTKEIQRKLGEAEARAASTTKQVATCTLLVRFG